MSRGSLEADPVVVTGRGALTPYGVGIEPYSTALRSGTSAIKDVELQPLEGLRPAALLPLTSEDWVSDWVARGDPIAERARRLIRRAPRPIPLALMASAEAWTEAGLIGEGHDARRQGVVVAGHDLAMGYEQGLRAKFDVSPHHLPPSFAVHMMDTDHVGALSEALSIEGYGMTVGGASASGTMALIEGAELIASGRIDQCLVVGPMADLSAMAIQAFDAIGALGGVAHGGHEASRPFDRGRDGFIFGQAVGALVLERGSLARKRGATVFGRILGTGVALDASAAPAPSAEGEARAMRQALQEAGLEPDAIDTINAHGTSSKAGDGVELEAIHSVFGEHTKSLRVQSTKGLIGHTLWAAGVIEALALLVQMQGGFVHPNANLMEPIRDDRGLVGGEAMTPGPTVAMSNSFGFGGINTSLVIACGDERGAP